MEKVHGRVDVSSITDGKNVGRLSTHLTSQTLSINTLGIREMPTLMNASTLSPYASQSWGGTSVTLNHELSKKPVEDADTSLGKQPPITFLPETSLENHTTKAWPHRSADEDGLFNQGNNNTWNNISLDGQSSESYKACYQDYVKQNLNWNKKNSSPDDKYMHAQSMQY
ncbi:hypothetical protein LOZ58_005135 [Ophidiomyces ophidiicola]|nr:hypothetical protein LOZ58_005135 [Ophidiomyces ophidiicola]